MVPSLYNVVAPAHDGQGYVLYNTLSRACVLLDDAELEAYRALCDDAEAESELAGQLAGLGFLVDDARVEYNFSRYEFEREKFENSILSLRICPTLDFERGDSDAFGCRRSGMMSREVQDAVVSFVHEQHERQPFTVLGVTWILDGSPAGIDAAKYLAEQFRALATREGVRLEMSALAVGGADGQALRQILAPSGVDVVETPESTERCLHTKAQPTEDQDFVHQANDDSQEVLAELGFIPHLRQDTLQDDAQVSLGSSLEIPSGGTNFDVVVENAEPIFKQRAMRMLDDFLQGNPSREDFEIFLEPLTSFCDAGVERAYAIDELGNAYGCAYDLGGEDHVLFNVCEPVGSRAINMKLIARYGNANPLDLQECATCRVFPLCKGGCARVRVEEGALTCAPQRYLIEEYLTAYSRFL